MIKAGVDLVIRFEGYSSTPYRCATGVWTIGFGTTRYPDGRRVTGYDSECTREQAESWLHHELEKAERAVIRYCKPYLNENQRAPLASFVYNLGSGAFRASTLRRRINTGDWDDVPYQIQRWNKAGGRILRGLTRRRAAEVELWNKSVIHK
tara:strand:+ start:76 stop:528 length:453 start_codon:yes stop_codon:yes gene_type:complete